jgi:DNA-binding GntR family transcriptional regulator
MKDVKNLVELRLIVESAAARMAAGRCDVAQLHRLDELCSFGYDPEDPDSIERFLAANTELHATVAQATGNERLASVVRQILDDIERVLYLGIRLSGSRRAMSHEHKALVSALEQGDGEAAAAVIADQMHAVDVLMSEALLGSLELNETNLAQFDRPNLAGGAA